MIACICAVLGWIIWIVGLGIIIGVILDKEVDGLEKFRVVVNAFLIMGMLGFVFNLPGICNPQRDIVVTYETPTSIIKTNDVTIVHHVSKEGYVVAKFYSKDAKYWNSTNIMIEVTSGKNFYGKDSDSIQVVTK